MPPPPPLTDEEKLALLRKSKAKFQAAKDEFGAEATAWHREQLKLAARDRCVHGPGAPGARRRRRPRARVRGGEDLSTWDAAARAAQTKKPAPVPESLDMKALREQAATGAADAQYRLGARLYEDKQGAEAEQFLKLAAALHAEACFALGRAYEASVDDGIRLDLQEALKYFRKAARAGHAAARRREPRSAWTTCSARNDAGGGGGGGAQC